MKTLIIAALLCVPGLLAVASFPVVDSSASECWAMATFQPDGSAFVKQNSVSSQAGRTCAAEPALSLSKGPYDGRIGVRKTKFRVESSGTFNTSSCTPQTAKTRDDNSTLRFGCDTSLGYPSTREKASKPMSSKQVLTQDSCQYLFGQGYAYNNEDDYLNSYDTLQLFVERCPFYPDYPASWRAFPIILSDVQGLYSQSGGDQSYISNCHQWLESVLYLNTIDPEYFCQCAEAIGGTLPGPDTFTRQIANTQGVNYPLAFIKWLQQNTNCDSTLLATEYFQGRYGQYQTWLDDSTLGFHYPYDTTLPPLDSIEPGLTALLDKHFLYSVAVQPQGIISNVTANPNPVTSGTVISFGISQEAYVKIEVFDILGHEVASASFESLFEPGNKSVPISLAGLPLGTYFARILTAYGEVQSVKLVKE